MLAGIVAYIIWNGNHIESGSIDWAKTGEERVAQNVLNLINTNRYEVAYDRTLGMSSSYIDRPLDQAIAEIITSIYELISEREPRAELKEVTFTEVDDSGNLQFRVVIDIVGY